MSGTAGSAGSAGSAVSDGELRVVDAATSEPIPCRIHLADPAGLPVAPPGCPAWKDHFVCDGSARLQLAPGTYRCRIERGARIVAAVTRPIDEKTTLKKLAELLPKIALPSRFVVLPEMPKTGSGKIDFRTITDKVRDIIQGS